MGPEDQGAPPGPKAWGGPPGRSKGSGWSKDLELFRESPRIEDGPRTLSFSKKVQGLKVLF